MKLPEDGQFIVATNEVGGCWVEEFNSDEPVGHMKMWFLITEKEFWEANSPISMCRLFIKKVVQNG